VSSVVVKIGTSSLTTASGGVDHEVFASVAADVAILHARGERVVVVTSGAITAGWAQVGNGAPRPSNPQILQAVSAVGQPQLMNAWRDAFAPHGLAVGQVLLAPLDFAHRGQYLHARGTLSALGDLGVIAIVNENDAVADEEIRFGDNDRLAALTANLIGAQRLVLLTDTDGLLTADPRLDPSATLIDEVEAIDHDLEQLAGASGSQVGSGGMSSKLAAERMATWSGVRTVIAPARAASPLVRAFDDVAGFGTTFLERSDRLSARKAWIAFALPSAGRLVINDGAVEALEKNKRSLLRVGVDKVVGDFDEGDAVEIVDIAGSLLAKGLVRVASSDFANGDDLAVHRDDLVLLRAR